MLKYLKENWISWIVGIGIVFLLIYNEEISIYSDSNFLKFFTIASPFVVLVLLIAFGEIFFGIHENLWDEFKKGRDIHIDKMMRNMRITFILILFTNIIWLFLILFNLSNAIQIEYIKSTLLILFPIIVMVYISKEFYALQKEYYS